MGDSAVAKVGRHWGLFTVSRVEDRVHEENEFVKASSQLDI